jgi:hypothetical protein
MFHVNTYWFISIGELRSWLLTRRGTSVILLVAIIFSAMCSADLRALPKLSSSAYDIPLAIPTTNSLNPPRSPTSVESESTNLLADNMISNLQIRAQGSEGRVSTLATCDKLPVSAITASGNDGNIPSNAIDGNLNTRWSNLGKGSWIQLDLGSTKSICNLDIAWYAGNTRQNNFVISVSYDGTTFINKLTGTSSGTTTSAERYTLPSGTEGRYVRITVDGNTQNEWASITEISVLGGASSSGGGDGGGDGGNIVGTLLHKWQTSADTSTWSSYSSLGGTMAPNTNVAVAMNSDGRLQVFVVGTNNQLYFKTQTAAGSSTWTGWTSLGGGVKVDTTPAVARNSDGRLQVFVVGTNNQLYYKTQTSPGSGTWSSSWTSLGGGLRAGSDPIAIANYDGKLQVFVVGTDNAAYYKTQTSPNSATWSSSWTYISGVVKADTSPAVARNADGRLQVFIVGANNQLQYRVQTSPNSNTWSSSWISLSGTLRGGTDPAVIANSDGRLQVFVVGTNNAVYYKAQSSPGSSTWSSSWASLGGGVKTDTGPAAARNTDGRLQAFIVGTNSALYYKTQSSPNSNTWSSTWTSLSGTLRDNSDPAVVPNSDGRLDAFVIGPATSGLANRPPTADSKSITTGTDTATDITLSGSDPDNNPITFSIIEQPRHGQLSSISAQNVVKYTPTTGYNGPDSFTYVARDSKGATSVNKATVSITVSSTDAGTNDKFGIKKIYPTKPGGEEWFMNMQDPNNDPRTKQIPMSKNADGSWKVTEDQVRYGVYTSSGYHPDLVVRDYSILATRGYMQSPNDWKNVEMTGQVKFNSGSDDDWTWYARGGRNTGNGWPEGCEGTQYKGSLEYTSGRVRWAKEQWHVSYVFSPWKDSPASGDHKFVGFKVVMYNFLLDGKTAVKMEVYVDPNNDNQWQKVYDWVDKGGWGSAGGECKGTPDQIITWGGPQATFRWDNANIDIKNLSVREIVPPPP